MTDNRNPDVIPKVREKISEALATIGDAEALLRSGNWPEFAGLLNRSRSHLGVWTAPGGYLETLEGPDMVEPGD